VHTVFQAQEMGRRVSDHGKQINDIQLSKDMNLFVTASKDFTAKVCLITLPDIEGFSDSWCMYRWTEKATITGVALGRFAFSDAA